MFSRLTVKHSFFELGTWLRNGEQALLNFLIPIAVYIATSRVENISKSEALAFSSLLAISASCFAGLAITTAFDRRYGSLKLLGMSPLGKDGFIGARVLTALMVAVIQFSLIAFTALLVEGQVAISLSLIPALLLSVSTWTTCALIISSKLRAEAVLAIANTMFIVFAASAFALRDSDALIFKVINPLAAALQASSQPLPATLILAVWSVMGFIIAKRNFTWV
jgi:ABC-2 type transport system permease protein